MCFAKSFKNRQEFVEYYSAMSDAVVTTRTYADGVTLTEVLDREDNGAILITNDSGNSVTGWLYDEGYEDYINTGCGMGREATLYLLERGVRVVGTDAWGWDVPMKYMAERYQQTKDASIIWEGHKAGKEIGYCQLEKLHNLEVLPADGFTVVCFPTKIRAASAGWTRAVAIVENDN